MADPVFSVTPKAAWTVASGPTGSGTGQYFRRLSGDDSNEISSPGDYVFNPSPWASQLSDTVLDIKVQRIVIDLSECNLILLKFFGFNNVVEQTNLRVGVGAIWGVCPIENAVVPQDFEYAGEYLGRFDLTLGTTRAASDSGVFQPKPGDGGDFGPQFSQRATVIVDRAAFPGLRTVGEYPLARLVGTTWESVSAAPVLALDALGYSSMIVELRALAPLGSSPSQGVANLLGFAYRMM